MTKRRTAERAVVQAAINWARFHDFEEYQGDVEQRLLSAVAALADVDLEPATATRTCSLPLATSEAAAQYMSKSVHRVAGLVFREILTAFRQGAVGLTTDAIEVRLNRSHQSVSPRVTDLRDQGWIRDSGLTRKTRWGQDAAVWEPTEAAVEVASTITKWSW